MINFVYRRSRRVNGKREYDRLYRGRVRLDGDEKIQEVPLDTPDKRIARKRLDEYVVNLQREREGLIAPRVEREAAQRPLAEHLVDYLADQQTRGNNSEHITRCRQRITRLLKDCGWTYPRDVRSDVFLDWRKAQDLAAKTLNEYLAMMACFLKWMIKHQRMGSNPLVNVDPISVRGKQTFRRRSLTDDEIGRLLDVSGPRRIVYLTALWTGLRRGELQKLRWSDVNLDDSPCLVVRSENSKNRREAVLPLHPELTVALRDHREERVQASWAVFYGRMPRYETVRRDFERAGIVVFDEDTKRKADFHSLRMTFATRLAVHGASERVRQELMRHETLRQTNQTYTDTSRLPTGQLINRMPALSGVGSQIRTHELVPDGQGVTQADPCPADAEARNSLQNKAVRHASASADTRWPNGQKDGEGGIRTPGTVARTLVFETSPFSRSGTSPGSARQSSGRIPAALSCDRRGPRAGGWPSTVNSGF
jgi:integrase